MSELGDTVVRLRLAIERVRWSSFRRRVYRAWVRAMQRQDHWMEWRLFSRLYPGVISPNDPVFEGSDRRWRMSAATISDVRAEGKKNTDSEGLDAGTDCSLPSVDHASRHGIQGSRPSESSSAGDGCTERDDPEPAEHLTCDRCQAVVDRLEHDDLCRECRETLDRQEARLQSYLLGRYSL